MAKGIDLTPTGIESPKKTKKVNVSASNTTKAESTKSVDLNFKVSPEFKRSFKIMATEFDLTQKQLLEKLYSDFVKSLNR